MKKNGTVIVFDGPDGVGKTTQLELTATWLKEQGHSVFTTRKSGGTEIGKYLRAASLSDAPRPVEVDMYLSLAMGTAVGKQLSEKRAEDVIILVDRSPMALVAYSIFGGQLEDTKIGYDAFARLMELWKPELCLYIDVPQAVADDRRAKRLNKPSDYFEKQNHAFHNRVREGYQKALGILRNNPNWYGELIHIDGQHNQDAVQDSIRQVVNKVL